MSKQYYNEVFRYLKPFLHHQSFHIIKRELLSLPVTVFVNKRYLYTNHIYFYNELNKELWTLFFISDHQTSSKTREKDESGWIKWALEDSVMTSFWLQFNFGTCSRDQLCMAGSDVAPNLPPLQCLHQKSSVLYSLLNECIFNRRGIKLKSILLYLKLSKGERAHWCLCCRGAGLKQQLFPTENLRS